MGDEASMFLFFHNVEDLGRADQVREDVLFQFFPIIKISILQRINIRGKYLLENI